jgi:hypothetical protein
MRKRRLGKEVKREVTPEFANMSKEILYPQIQGVTVTSSLMVGESEPGCGLCPSLSLKDFHHQGWGGECAELGSAPAWAVARSFTQ